MVICLCQRGLDLVAHIIARLLLRSFAHDLRPSRADDDQGGVAAGHRVVDGLLEPLSRPDIFDIHEDAVGSDHIVEVVAQPAGPGRRVFSAIADEYVSRGASPVR